MIRARNALSLDAALADAADPSELVSALLYSCGFPYVDVEREGSALALRAGHTPNAMLTQVTVGSEGELSGPLAPTLRRAFLIASALERGDLDVAAYLPVDMRSRRVDAVIALTGGDRVLFETVLRNWHA